MPTRPNRRAASRNGGYALNDRSMAMKLTPQMAATVVARSIWRRGIRTIVPLTRVQDN